MAGDDTPSIFWGGGKGGGGPEPRAFGMVSILTTSTRSGTKIEVNEPVSFVLAHLVKYKLTIAKLKFHYCKLKT